jgi:hypothetical protein
MQRLGDSEAQGSK